MPFINVKTNNRIENSVKEKVKTELGQAITLIQGKSERWLMVNIEDDSFLYFQGNDESACYVEVKIYGNPSSSDCDNLTNRITGIIHRYLNIKPERIYVAYFSTPNWGFAGSNF